MQIIVATNGPLEQYYLNDTFIDVRPKPIHSRPSVWLLFQLFADIPNTPPTTVAEFEDFIQCAHLQTNQVQAVLSEQLDRPQRGSPTPFIFDQKRMIVSLARSTRPTPTVSLEFPIDVTFPRWTVLDQEIRILRFSNQRHIVRLLHAMLQKTKFRNFVCPCATCGSRQFFFSPRFFSKGVRWWQLLQFDRRIHTMSPSLS